MTISDEELRSRLEQRAIVASDIDLAADARTIASGTRRRGFGRRAQILGAASAAASVVLAVALAGSVVLRSSEATNLPSSNSTAAGSPSVATTPAPIPAVAWTNLVWEEADGRAFAFDGATQVVDGIAHGDGFLVIGSTSLNERQTGRIWRSSDGRSWSRVESDWLETAQLDMILRVGNGFVIVGRQEVPNANGTPGPTRPAVWWSDDGSDWVERTPDSSEDLFFSSVASGPAGLLISARDQRDYQYWLRADSDFRWTRLDQSWPAGVRILGIAATATGWIAVGATGAGTATTISPDGTQGAIWTSVDAMAWEPAMVDQPGGSIDDVHLVGNRLVAIGSERGLRCDGCLGGPIVLGRDLVTWVSSDGRSWRRGSEREVGSLRVGDAFTMTGGLVSAGADRILAFESTADGRMRVWQTLDGVAWSEVGVLDGQPSDVGGIKVFPGIGVPVVIGPNGLVAFGYDGTSTTPAPRYAAGESSTREDLPTFDPLPEQILNDVACPGEEPCGP